MRPFLSRALALGFLATAASWSPVAEAKFVFQYNHPDLDWYSVETEHFVVHYPESRKKDGNEHYLTTEWTARKTAKVSEEMWPRMCGEFNYFLKEKIHIVLLNQSDDLEGFTIPNWDWIEISANPGGDFYRQRGRMDWLPDVLVHEFAHVVSLKANGTMAEGVQGVSIGGLYSDGVADTESGGEFFLMDGDPFYWTEGGAEYYSDEAGYNWWTPSRDAHIRTTVLEERLLSYDEWQTRAQTFGWGDGERGYQQGYSFALYLRQRFGNDTYQRFALEFSKGWRAEWGTVIEDVTGVPGRQLYDDWVAYITKKYTEQYDRVKAEGEVAGREMTLAANDWEYTDPDGRDAFYDKRWNRKWGTTGKDIARREREKAKEKMGTYQMVPRYSDDGKWYAVNSRGTISFKRAPESSWVAFSGTHHTDAGVDAEINYQSDAVPSEFMHAWDFVPGKDAVIVTGNEHMKPGHLEHATGVRFEGDGYQWKNLWYIPIPINEGVKDQNIRHRGVKKGSIRPATTLFNSKQWKEYRPIPNTLRGSEPSVSPDGSKIAYLQYDDGTLNLVTINMDGTDKKFLTDFHDGTWMQRVDWSPDGKQLVVGIFRNFQQDLYVINADGTGVQPIMYDRWEDMDPNWAADGQIYFSSDHSGIFNIYRYDPTSKHITQVTNVIGGAEAPSVTPEGNILYTAYTAHGWKTYGLAKEDVFEKDVTEHFGMDWEPEAVQASWGFREDLSAFKVEKYRGALMAPTGVPLLRMTNDALDNFSLQAGGQIFVQDYVEKNGFFVTGMIGEDLSIQGQYFNQMWYPTFILNAAHYEVKYHAGYLLDGDQNTNTAGDQSYFEIKNQQYYNVGTFGIDVPWNGNFRTFGYARYLELGFKTTSEDRYQPYSLNAEAGLFANFSNIAYFGGSANPYGGRNVDVGYAHGYTDVVYAPQSGRSTDDGELLDNYEYNRMDLRWTEQILVPGWGSVLQAAQDHKHTIQIDFQAGVIDRNVDLNDEFRAGGQHPFYFGSDSLRPNTLFAGYPANSLSGETMALVNLAYRFPIRREFNRRVGPLYIFDFTGQIMGSAGNLWSFRAPNHPAKFYRNEYGERVVYDASTLRREIPFIDSAYKNGNYLLYDAGAELRMSASLFNGATWNSFVRGVYGFNEIHGYGDVNGDDVNDTTDNAIGDELSNETEKPGLRIYIGLGTGW